jgi:hypothetical protein
MCGGVRFQLDGALAEQLREAYSPEQLREAQEAGSIVSVFWQPRPVLPAIVEGHLGLYDWGNREKDLKLPQTGWARLESLEAGKWNYLHPQEVLIPATQGLEKKVWFDIEQGIRGYLVRRGDIARVYMLTEAASEAYRARTGHDRMPVLLGQTL